ncbi:melanopsin-A-like [Amphiura filiformis]|uniref:melanopsin-A-like n=1 Tax=Amphiura filiformis TaxID=82378 RepID=UPI003B220D8B
MSGRMSAKSCTSSPFNPPGRTASIGDCLPCFEPHDQIVDPILYFIGFFANLYTIVLISLSLKRGKTSASGCIPTVLVLALCSTDFACLILGEIFWLVSSLHGTWLGGKTCHLYSIFFIATCTRLSRCIVVIMGLERYMSFKRPFLYDEVTTNRRVAMILLILTLYSLLSAGLYTFVVSGHVSSRSFGDIASCLRLSNNTTLFKLESTLESVYDYWTLIESVLLLVILIYCNIVVIICMRTLKAKMSIMCPRNRQEYMKQQEQVRGIPAEFSRLMVAITVLTLINIVPYEVRVLVNKFNVWHSPTADAVAVNLYLSLAIINPLLYGIFRRKSRRNIRGCLINVIRLLKCCPNSKVQPAPTTQTPTPPVDVGLP